MSLSQIMSESEQHVTESNVSFVTDSNDVIETNQQVSMSDQQATV